MLYWRNVLHALAFSVLIALYVVFLRTPINPLNADIGRHIMNGLLLLEQHDTWWNVLHTNLYSYTYPDFPVINHHWGSGVVFAIVFQATGWAGLHILFIGLSLLALLFFVDTARRCSNEWIAVTMGIAMLPFIVERLEVRPEVFSYLFIGYFVWLLTCVLRGDLPRWWLWVLPVVETLWANVHVYFPFGVFLIGIFGIPALVRRDWPLFTLLLIVGIVTAFTTIITPFGVPGALYPFFIFGNYGYKIVENQSVFFLEDWGLHKTTFMLLRVWSVLLALGIVHAFLNKQWKDDNKAPLFLFGITVTALAWFALRNFTLFGLVMIPVGALIWQNTWTWLRPKITEDLDVLLPMSVCSFLIATTWYTHRNDLAAAWQYQAFGAIQHSDDLNIFLQKNQIPQPIFNNYDIGGYLIFGQYPNMKVFVDNRPEAYPTSFFTDVYIPMQEDDSVWQAQLAEHDFQSIIFYYRDVTNWAQDFLRARLADENWVPVYADQQSIIFVRNTAKNRTLINKHYIDKSMFSWR